MGSVALTKLIQYAVVGEESLANFRLFCVLRGAFGQPNVRRFLALHHLDEFLSSCRHQPAVICLDLFSYDLESAASYVAQVRDHFPTVVFTLYVDKDVYEEHRSAALGAWPARFDHYYKLYKEAEDTLCEPVVRASLRHAQVEAVYNMGGDPVRLTPATRKGIVGTCTSDSDLQKTLFLSYSRMDWDSFVHDVVDELAKYSHRMWLDQNYIIGGDDWLDAIGVALHDCDTLLLVLSPDALISKWVKMEYRFFCMHNKPIVPILCRRIDSLPFELATLHYLDFTAEWRPEPLRTLHRVLANRYECQIGD